MTTSTKQDTRNEEVTDNTRSSADSSTVAFRLSNNLIIVEASINGVSASMILDTGAGRTVISQTKARSIGLSEGRESCTGRGAGGEVEMASANIDSLAIGSMSKHDFTSVTMDMSDLHEQLESEVHGIIGFDFLSEFKLTIDYPKRQLALQAAETML